MSGCDPSVQECAKPRVTVEYSAGSSVRLLDAMLAAEHQECRKLRANHPSMDGGVKAGCVCGARVKVTA